MQSETLSPDILFRSIVNILLYMREDRDSEKRPNLLNIPNKNNNAEKNGEIGGVASRAGYRFDNRGKDSETVEIALL